MRRRRIPLTPHSPPRLNLYRFIEDAWSGGLRAWCLEPSGPTPLESWILLENPGQSRWLLRKLSQTSIPPIRIFDPDSLRTELARIAGITPAPPLTASFAIAAAAGEGTLPARNATPLAEACDTLARSGWHLNQLPIGETLARRIHRALAHTSALPGFLDRRLRESLPALPARLCCIGWDATHWPDLSLLDLAASKAAAFEMYVPSPRLPADSHQREWIETLEQRLHLERNTCPESTFASENEPLVARLENSRLSDRAEARPPCLIVGREWPDQVALVSAQVIAWLADSPAAPIGLIAPPGSPTAIAVAEALAKAGVPVEHPARIPEPAAPSRIIGQVAQYHLSGHDISDLLELTRLLWLDSPSSWPALDPGQVRSALDHAFQAAQSRNSRILAQAQPHRKDPVWAALCDLVDALGRWDAQFPWPAIREKWTTLLLRLHLPPDTLAPILPPLPDPQPIHGRLFMQWIATRLAADRRTPPLPDYAALAPVVVTTFANAAQQTWDRLIFLDSNEHIWPAPFLENPFLPDATRLRLNHNRQDSAHLLTTRDLRLLDQARFLDLIEHCRAPIAFAGLLLAHTDTGDHAQPNEWVLRSLIETSGHEFPPDLWSAAAQSSPPPAPPPLDPAELLHLQRVHASRRNAAMPFDRYHFNFHETRLESRAWSATDLDKAIVAPATFALKVLFQAEPTATWSPTRHEGAAVGNRAHRWLGRLLGPGNRLTLYTPASNPEPKVFRELSAARAELEQWYGAESLPVPIWWETCLRKTAWAARRCLREVRGWLDAQYCATEQSLAVTVQTPRGPLLLKGRIDILISDRPEIRDANIRMFDFKTGRGQPPSLTNLQRGQGAQFAAYYLMARDTGAATAVIAIIKPEDPARDIFTPADEEPLRAHFALLANLQRDLRFGQRPPPPNARDPSETLPLATVPIDPAILYQKASIQLLAQ